ncbi:MAG: PD-(D/E)XK nuclease family protein [Woeseiaceae bacterium]|nr:PD-(D/E)XK nuclease family protein [Woeseiaceae bacterium]
MADSAADRRYPWLEEQLANGATVVTGSRRLARDLVDVWSERQTAAGKLAWETPSIHYWPDWLSRFLTNADDPSLVPQQLNALSVSILWEKSLAGRVPDGVLNVGGVVRQSSLAWQRLCQWSVPVNALAASASTDDERLFAAAAKEYTDRLHEDGWTDPGGIPAAVLELLRNDPTLVPRQVALAGFDRLSPAAVGILQVLEEQGCRVTEVPAAEHSQHIRIASFADESAELRAAGRWAQQVLASYPSARIAIVVPRLENAADRTARLVREGLVPGWQYGGAPHRAAANVSFGRRLVDYPSIAVALLLLRWVTRGLPGAEIGILLRSDLTGSVEKGGRARLELALRSHPDREWTPAEFCGVMTGLDDTHDAFAFVEMADSLVAHAAASEEKRLPPIEWVKRVDALLELAGWPGSGPQDSKAFQLVNRWRELLNEFAQIEVVAENLSWPEAVARISSLAAETVWQPEVGRGAVQVLGPLEAFGMEFDHVWLCGMDATQWPAPSRPLPFVSRALQRERDMPDATPADTLGFAHRLLKRLTGSAPACVLSWSEMCEDAEQTASTLLDGIDSSSDTNLDDIADPGWAAATFVDQVSTVVIENDQAPPVGADENVRGGAYTIQRQYKEPFSAFVFGRLGIRTPDPYVTGLSPSVRGNIIHNALHNLLVERPDQAAMAGWSSDERMRRIGSAIDAALERQGRHADAVLQRIIGLERRRLYKLLANFLDSECMRPQFTVTEVEKSVEYRRVGLALDFQIDRIDQLPDGRLLVVDYKTGATKSFLAQDGSLKDMQLVAYVDALQSDVAGMTFINVDPRGIILRGAGEGWRKKEDPDWHETLGDWIEVLHEVVAGLAAGDASIDIRQHASDGRSLNILSRLQEQKRVS